MNYRKLTASTLVKPVSVGKGGKYPNVEISDEVTAHNLYMMRHVLLGYIMRFDLHFDWGEKGKINMKHCFVASENDGFIRWRTYNARTDVDPIFYKLVMDKMREQPWFPAIGGTRQMVRVEENKDKKLMEDLAKLIEE